MKNLKRIVVPVVVLLGLGGAAVGAYRYQKAHQAPVVRFKTGKVEKRDIIGKVTASGTLLATVTVQVGTQVSGRVQRLFVDFNSPVKKGELVAKIDPLLFEAAVAQAQANYLSAKAGVTKAEAQALDADRQLVRARSLHANSLASQQDMETAETNAAVAHAQIDVARASLAQAQASLNQAQVNLSYTSIVSPIDGTVISRNVDVGQTVAASLQAPVLFTIAEDLRKMQVNTNVAEGDVGRLQPGMPVYFTVDAYPGQKFRAKIGQIRNAAQTVQNVVTYNAVIDVDNADLRLRPGMTANATIIYTERRGVLAVPNAALRFRPPDAAGAPSASSGSRGQHAKNAGDAGTAGGGAETRTVWVLSGQEPSAVQVQAGLTDGSFTELIDGTGPLSEGSEVIVDTVAAKDGTSPPPAPGAGGGAARRPF